MKWLRYIFSKGQIERPKNRQAVIFINVSTRSKNNTFRICNVIYYYLNSTYFKLITILGWYLRKTGLRSFIPCQYYAACLCKLNPTEITKLFMEHDDNSTDEENLTLKETYFFWVSYLHILIRVLKNNILIYVLCKDYLFSLKNNIMPNTESWKTSYLIKTILVCHNVSNDVFPNNVRDYLCIQSIRRNVIK